MDIAGTGFITTYAYTLATRTTTVTQGVQTRTFQTDAAGRSIYTSEPERGITQYGYAYNSTGLALTRTRPTANQPQPTSGTAVPTTKTVTQSDALGRTVSVTYTDGTPAKQFTYDQASTNGGTAYNIGQLTNASTVLSGNTVASSTQLNYSIIGNVSDTSQCMPNQCGNAAFDVLRYYVYDPVVKSRTQESYLSGGASGTRVSTNMTYSVAGELLTMSNTLTGAAYNSGSIVSVASAQNSVFGPTGYSLGNGLNGVLSYDLLGRNSGISLCMNSTSANCSGGSQTYQMTQSVSGSRVTAMTDTVLGTNVTPSYDEFNRLNGINYSTRGQKFSYQYDRYGNRWFQNVVQGTGPSTQLSFNVNNQINSAGYTYDVAGNMTSDGSHSYSYDAEGNMVSVDGGSTATYIYDALNHRVRVTMPATSSSAAADTYYTFNTDGLRVASWNATTASPTMLAAYTYWNGMPIATYTGSGVTYAHQDLLGTKRLTTTSTGSLSGSYQSLPFGDTFATQGTDSDPSHFALLDHDAASNTEHAQFRQYASTSGQWMSPDPYDGSYDNSNPQSLNRYTYGGNNPLVYIDPSGLDYTYCPPGVTIPPEACTANGCYQPNVVGCYTYSDYDWGVNFAGGYGVGATGPAPQSNGGFDCGGFNCGSVTYTDTQEQAPNTSYSSIPFAQVMTYQGFGTLLGNAALGSGPHYTMSDVCAASALLNKGGAAALDLLGTIPGENTVVKGAQFLGSLISAGMTVFGPSSPTDAVFTGVGSGIAAVDFGKVMTTGAEAVPVVGNVVSGVATINDVYGKEGIAAYYDDCMAGKN